MTRAESIRARHRRLQRSQGQPVNLSQPEVIEIRREIADAIAQGKDIESVLTEIADRHGVSRRKVRWCGMAMFCGRPPLLTYAAEIRNGRAGMSERHRTHVKGWSE